MTQEVNTVVDKIEEIARAIWLAKENLARQALGMAVIGELPENANWSTHLVAARAAYEVMARSDGEANAVRLALEDADTLERLAEDADENAWLDWAVTMRVAAEHIRAALTQESCGGGQRSSG